MIRICDSSVVEPLCLGFEKSSVTGAYPSAWKKANVVPIHKKDGRQNTTDYRPISLLPTFGNIFEKVMFDKINQHLSVNEFLTH